MLSIGKLAAGPDAGRYYEEAVAQGREDYYRGRGEAPGRWVGGGSTRLGLVGRVSEGGVSHLLDGEHPQLGSLLGRAFTEGSVAGFDLTFKAPKSVSILFGIGGPVQAVVLRVAHEAAVDDALAHLEREACLARRGKDGLVQVRGEGFLAAAFRHRTSRAGDPLLHTHVVVANRTLGPDGRWTALDGRPLYAHAKTAGYVYQARLRHEITERLGLQWGEITKGSAELAGFSRPLIEHFSRRRAEIVEALARHDGHSLAAGNAAALATRKGKDYAVSYDRLQDEWRARAVEHGFEGRHLSHTSPADAAARPLDLDGLTARQSTFTRRDALQAVAEHHRAGSTAEQIEAETKMLLGEHPDVVRLDDPRGARYTTRAQLDLEQGLLDHVEQRCGVGIAVARQDAVDQAIETRSLSDEQARVVRDLCARGDGIEAVRAPAGAGKTFALDAAREAWQASGNEVIGCALSARAAIELHDQAGIETTTIARLTQRLDRGAQLTPDSVLVVDEAGMVGTRDLANLADPAAHADAKLVLVGDDRQLPEIEAGGGFRAIADRTPALALTETRRQHEAWDRGALRALRDGNIDTWADAYYKAGRLVSGPNAPAVRAQLAEDWWHSYELGDDSAIIALRRTDVSDLNQRARQQMRDAGRLRSDDVVLGDRAYAEGDRVVLGHNDRHLHVVNGDRGEIVDLADSTIDVQLDRGDTVRLPTTYATDGHLDHGYALTAHKAQGATFDRAYVLGSDEAYREWGYTALSRHRQASTFYITAPQPFLNSPRLPDLDAPVERATSLLNKERRNQLALDLTEGRDPAALHAQLPDLDKTQSIPEPAKDLDLDLGWDLGP